MIRLIWAYLFAAMDVGHGSGAHLGFLIFDEPQQQQTARSSYHALLSQAALRGAMGRQVIFATSEPAAGLEDLVSDGRHNIISLEPGEKLLVPLA